MPASFAKSKVFNKSSFIGKPDAPLDTFTGGPAYLYSALAALTTKEGAAFSNTFPRS